MESGVAMEHKFYLLFQLLADQIGNLVNKHELANTIQVDNKTIDNYLYVLERCYHIHLVKPFFRNLRKELTKMPKIFFNDLGLRNVLLNRFGEVNNRLDKGALLENYFFSQFHQQYNYDQMRYWHTSDGKEVDFVIEESFGKGKAYEVKWDKTRFKPNQYQKFVSSYPEYKLSCLGMEDFVFV